MPALQKAGHREYDQNNLMHRKYQTPSLNVTTKAIKIKEIRIPKLSPKFESMRICRHRNTCADNTENQTEKN